MDTADINPWKIDHIYVSASLGPALSSATVIRAAGFHTDHLPVQADLVWP